jgi:hypothetical protein
MYMKPAIGESGFVPSWMIVVGCRMSSSVSVPLRLFLPPT